jgi:hypothetical protein
MTAPDPALAWPPFRDSSIGAIAWRDFILYASAEPEILAAFKAATGLSFVPPKNGLEAMIDKATGHTDATAEEFVIWATVNLWGASEAPPAYRAMLAERGIDVTPKEDDDDG